MNTSGFYKQFDDFVAYAPNFVIAPGVELIRSAKDSYQFPVDGWHWFDNKQNAESFFGTNIQIDGQTIAPSPENWNMFNSLMLMDIPFQQYTGQCLQIAPALALALPAALTQVADKGIESFSTVYSSFCLVANVSSADRARWRQFAVNANLRIEFVDLI